MVSEVLPASDHVTIITSPKSSSGACPLCGTVSGQVHSHYIRTLADLPWQGRKAVVQVRARRFRCIHSGCQRRIFTERLPDVAIPRARRTVRLGDIQRHIGFALGGEPGSRLATRLSMPVSGDTLLRMIRATSLEMAPSPRVIGIDDWSWRRGLRYGTIICDLERGRVIDLLPDRTTDTVTTWLQQHRGIEVIARDRAGAYAEGARLGAAQAIQVADRWHLLRNLGDALQGAVDRHRGAVHQAVRATVQGHCVEPPPSTISAHSTKQTRMLADRRIQRQARYEELHRLKLSGLSAEAIAPALGMSATVARRWLQAGGPPVHAKPRQFRPMDLHLAFLERRWSEGSRNASQLWRELRKQGFTGSRGPVARWVAHRRREDPSPDAVAVRHAAAWPAPSSRRCAWLLTTPADKLDAREETFLSCLNEIVPDLTRAGALAVRFANLVRAAPDPGNEPALSAWLLDAKGTLLDSFVRGIQRDYDAVLAGLVESWSNGPVEGQVNRLKLLKRSMYGRAGYDLLRRRVLAAA